MSKDVGVRVLPGLPINKGNTMFAGYMSSEEIMQHIVETVEDIAIQCQDCFDGVEEPVAE